MACEDTVDSSVELSPDSAALESEILSSSGRLGGSLPRDSKCHPAEGIGNFEIVALGLKVSLPCCRTGSPLVFRDIWGFPILGTVIMSGDMK